jgi:hypothetical protein
MLSPEIHRTPLQSPVRLVNNAFVICPFVFDFSPSDSALNSLVSLVSAMQGGAAALFPGRANGCKAHCSHWQMFNAVLLQKCEGDIGTALTGRTHEPGYPMTLYCTCSRVLCHPSLLA